MAKGKLGLLKLLVAFFFFYYLLRLPIETFFSPGELINPLILVMFLIAVAAFRIGGFEKESAISQSIEQERKAALDSLNETKKNMLASLSSEKKAMLASLSEKEKSLLERESALAAKEKSIKERLMQDYAKKEQALINHDICSKKEIALYQRELKKQRNCIESIISDSSQSYPWLATLFADYYHLRDIRAADKLKDKKHPAIVASEKVREIASEKRELIQKCKQLEYQIAYWESVFPWLEEFKEVDPKEAFSDIKSGHGSDYDAVRDWLSPSEYENLSNIEKYQLALERYLSRPKTNWQIGIDFERYVGYLYEITGYRVTYLGATLGFEDMGRDLLAEKGATTLVIQCKRWAHEKTIHEKHIFQLYGSIVLLKVQNPSRDYQGVFITTTTLSDVAKQCAEHLGIKYIENHKVGTYPMVKCNISSSGAMIYHLPFDQQYDRTVIDISKGESYVFTIAEAESLGFRRAKRWIE